MSFDARRAWLAALSACVLAAGSTGVALGAAQEDPPIDARTDPAEAGKVLDQYCADKEKCSFENYGGFTNPYSPSRIVGDALFNCSEEGDAETAVSVTDERGERTSLSESASLEISGGFLDLEKSTLEFKAFSGQASSFSTTVKVTQAVTVPPGWKGWTEVQLLSGAVTGSAYVTQGIHLIEVKNIDMLFPGWEGEEAKKQGLAPVVYIGTKHPMTADEIESHCGAIGATTSAVGAAKTGRAAKALQAVRKQRFQITLCRPGDARPAGGRRCRQRTVTGAEPRRVPNATAKLTRGRLTYAVENDRRGGIRLTQRRKITPGRYTLTIRERPRRMVVRHQGKVLHRALQHMVTTVPITIRG